MWSYEVITIIPGETDLDLDEMLTMICSVRTYSKELHETHWNFEMHMAPWWRRFPRWVMRLLVYPGYWILSKFI